ncbi:uncharacterized protein LOC6643519 [Drosophila willistoni]|uniref:uncharacterized protein LOC6643519 n=1 Tax=Drosophila willistoni TaxID=7260 RepID=UPI000C26C171|nr:uncharacterized protein LOC6643519 [Drosophila willistoni]
MDSATSGRNFKHSGQQQRFATSHLTYKMLSKMPLNLRKKAIREARNRREQILGKRKNRQPKKNTNSRTPSPNYLHSDFDSSEHNAMLSATNDRLRHILMNCKELSDIPHDCNQLELFGEIALVEGQATTIYVQRDGLDTLKVILHQSEPTLAQLKKAIAELSLTQLKRKQQESHQEQHCSSGRRPHGKERQDREQQQVDRNDGAIHSSTGELVHSGQRNGHDHRAFVSWRFLWRCFVLYNVDTNQPINDQANGRTKLHELGIKNAATLKFVHRIKYFGRRRQ